jgi:hypothetical protein
LKGLNINRRTVDNGPMAGLALESVEDMAANDLAKPVRARPRKATKP